MYNANHGDDRQVGRPDGPSDEQRERRGSRARGGRSGLKQWIVFLAVATALFLLVWAGWSVTTHRITLPYMSNVVRSDSPATTSATIGLTPQNDAAAPQTLDIRTAESPELDRALIGNVYQTLVGRADDNTLTAAVASSWKTSDDAKTLTFTLRDDLTFSNGDRLDSSDVVTSLQRAIEGKWPGTAERFAALESVTNPDRRTVRITLSHPDATLPYTLSGRLGIVYDADATVDYATRALGSGPFTVSRFAKGESITLTARTDGTYASRSIDADGDRGKDDIGRAARTGTIRLRYFADDAALVAAAKKGSLDMAVPADPANARTIAADSQGGATPLTAVDGASTRKVTLLFNNDADSPLSMPRVRQSLRMIVDRQAILNGRTDVSKPLGGPIGPLEPGYEDLTSTLTHDVAQAQSLLAYFGSRYLGTFTLITPARYESIARAIADQMTAAGLTVDVQVLDQAQLAERVASRGFTMMITELDGEDGTASFADAESASHYTNATAQQQYEAAVGATSQDAYANGLKTYARTISEDAASDWLYARKVTIAASTRIEGYTAAMADDRLPLADLARK